MVRAEITHFTPEQYENYKAVKPMMCDLYPHTMKSHSPLPLSPEAINRMKSDPYIKFTDEALDDFFTIWQNRREYAMGVCLHQKYYCDAGLEQGDIPLEVIANRANHLALYARSINFQQRRWIPKK